MSAVNVDLINGPKTHTKNGRELTPVEADFAQSAEFEEHLGVEVETLKAKTTEIDPEQLKQLNEDFLHSSVALNALQESYNSSSKQNAVSYKGEESLKGSGEHLMHANRELSLGAQELVLATPDAPVV